MSNPTHSQSDNRILYFATAGAVLLSYVLVLLLGLASSGAADAAVTWIFLAEAAVVTSAPILGLARVLTVLFFIGGLFGAVYFNDKPKRLYYLCSAALVFVALPDLVIAGTLLLRGLESECSQDGGLFLLRLCPTDAERPMCIVFAAFWIVKVALTIATWRAAKAGAPKESSTP